MCGRYSFFSSTDILEKRFHAQATEALPKHYNAAPSECLPMIPNDDPKTIKLGVWGFHPRWLKTQAGPINARAESIAEKPMFRDAMRKRRCLILADSFFEWSRTSSPKVPWRILLRDEHPFAFAGIWEPATSPTSAPTFAIITTRANKLVERVHDRMPVILEPSFERVWLHPNIEPETAIAILKPYPAEHMQMYPVSTRVNSARIDEPDLIKPIEQAA